MHISTGIYLSGKLLTHICVFWDHMNLVEDQLFGHLAHPIGTVCQRQFVTRTVYTLLSTDSNRTFLACVLMIDSNALQARFRTWRALNSRLLTYCLMGSS